MNHTPKTLLITGFEPFGGQTINPSWEAVRALPSQIGNCELIKLQIPTEFHRAAEYVLKQADSLKPDVILCIGQAGGRKGITPEVIAINLQEASIPDNAGRQPTNTPVIPNGPAAYFSTTPIRDMVKEMQDHSIPCSLSYSAGAFVCNDVFYTLSHHYAGTQTRIGFIHVPFLPEQAKKNEPSLPLDQIVKGLCSCIEVL